MAELENFERNQLTDAFGVVQTLQPLLSQRYRRDGLDQYLSRA